jgi:hypothetical protein
MEIPVFVLVVLWFAVACLGVLFGVAVMALPSAFSWFRRTHRLAKVATHHNIPPATVRRMDRESLVLEGETIYLAD